MELRLVSAASGLASKPYFLTIGLLYDREPRLTLRSAGVGKRVTPQARIPLAIHAADDFGLADLALEIEKTELGGEKPVTTSQAPGAGKVWRRRRGRCRRRSTATWS